MDAYNEKNIFKILVATDNHLGYMEKDAERGNDSFIAFEEILELAVEKDVDFILLGGDLFHDNKPSRSTTLRCMELLRKYTFGDKPVHFDFVSDPVENFSHLKNPTVNYQDPNLNVSIPVFSIHGNHDDPSGLGQHSPLEMLSTVGLVNYFGRINDLNEVKISPLLMTKGNAKLCLFGLSSLKDERLFRLFKENKVTMLRPKEDMEDWFNILVLHQNHTRHSLSNYIPEEFLDSFLDLVIWGHEHECLIEPRESTANTFNVVQPGSSVATSLCAGEAVQKHVALLEVNSTRQMRLTKLPLKTVRPFIFEDISLKDEVFPKKAAKGHNPIEEHVYQYVTGMIERAKELLTGHPKQPSKPLIRLRVEYEDESQMFNICRFGSRFTETVANAEGIILYRKFRDQKNKDLSDGIDQDAMDSVFNADNSQTKVEDLVEQYFKELNNDDLRMHLLSERGLAFAVGQFIEKEDRDAIHNIFEHQVNKTRKHLGELEDFDEGKIDEALEDFYLLRMSKKEQDQEETIAALSNTVRKPPPSANGNNDQDAFEDSDLEIIDDEAPVGRTTRGTSRSTRGRRGARGTNKTRLDMVGSESNARSPAKGRAKRGTRGRGSSTNTRTPSIMESFSRASNRSTTQKYKGAVFDCDSDSN